MRVERSGGFTGRSEAAEVDVESSGLGPLVWQAVASPAAEDAGPRPDMFVYTFTVEGREPLRVPEHLLTDSQAELARQVLRRGTSEV